MMPQKSSQEIVGFSRPGNATAAERLATLKPRILPSIKDRGILRLMDIQRTVTVVLPDVPELRATLEAFREVQQRLSPICFNDGKPLGAFALQRAAYHAVKGALSAQMTISAMRHVSGAYASAVRQRREITAPFDFKRRAATFLVGKRGRDADFRMDGTLSIWTAVEHKAQEAGMLVAEVDPRYTSQTCSWCGLRGARKRHRFFCRSCGFEAHADVNAAINVRLRYTVFRHGGPSSCGSEARSSDAGKPPAFAGGS
jgi:hypothetical protein